MKAQGEYKRFRPDIPSRNRIEESAVKGTGVVLEVSLCEEITIFSSADLDREESDWPVRYWNATAVVAYCRGSSRRWNGPPEGRP